MLFPKEFNKGLFDYLIATDDIYAGVEKKPRGRNNGKTKEGEGGKRKGKGTKVRMFSGQI